ncbi:HAD-IA family hydrolase [Alsobacter sp. R-9]
MTLSRSDLRPTVVFDLDGTLADTAADLIDTLNVILARENVAPVPAERIRPVVGAGAKAMIQYGMALDGRSVSEARLAELFRDFLDHYSANLAVRTRLFPGAESSLRRLAASGHRLAVCTNKVEAHAVQLLEALGVAPLFGAICGRDSFPWTKPDARHLTGTVEKAGGNPRHAVMVGDSRTDIDTARNAGLPVIAVTFGYTEVPVTQLGPDVVIDHFDALEGALGSLAAPRAAVA